LRLIGSGSLDLISPINTLDASLLLFLGELSGKDASEAAEAREAVAGAKPASARMPLTGLLSALVRLSESEGIVRAEHEHNRLAVEFPAPRTLIAGTFCRKSPIKEADCL
jgi:hypothetical protein